MTGPGKFCRRAVIAVGLCGAAGLATLPGAVFAAEMALASVIKLDETVISGNQELPKVLYIVPWQSPDGLPEIELAVELPEADLFRRLYPPAYRRELAYFETAGASAPAATADATKTDQRTTDSKE